MSNNPNSPHNLPVRITALSLFAWALWTWKPGAYADELHIVVWYVCAFLFAASFLDSLKMVGQFLAQIRNITRVFGRDTSWHSASFLSERDILRRGLHQPGRESRFIGVVGRTALELWTETSHLILGPAGSWKTTAAILPILLGCPLSAFITDIKGELWIMTRLYRERWFKHTCLKIDPKDPDNSAKVNPLGPAIKMLATNDPEALTYVRGMAFQLAPDPEGGGGANETFYQGARGLITTVVFAVLTVLPPEHCNLATVYRTLSDLDLLHELLEAASKSTALNGEVADMARSTHLMAFGDDGNAKTFGSFRINALIALEAFGPGNYLAAITSETSFEFSELKEKPCSIYVMIDFANSEVLGKFSGLLQWMAADALVKVGNKQPVLFILDEFCNAPLRILPKILTLLRSFGVRVVMATQDLDDITRVYSKHALETVLSEADIKQFLGGIRSKTTLDYISSYLGEFKDTNSSFTMGTDHVQESVSRSKERLLTEDHIRRLPKDAQIVIYGTEKPILAKKVQAFAVEPWRKRLGTNGSYGNKPFLLPVEVRERRKGLQVTRHGHRLYKRLAAIVHKPDLARQRVRRYIFETLFPSTALIAAAALMGWVYVYGLPNIMWQYSYRETARNQPVSYLWCSYIGPTTPGRIYGPECPLIIWRKTW